MDGLLTGYASVVAGVRVGLFYAAVVAAGLAVMDWAVRTRRINPFSGIARFFRARVDPLLAPVERTVLRAGGRPSTAPWWMLLVVVIGGLMLLWLFDFVFGLLREIEDASRSPRMLPLIFVQWSFSLLEFAILVRVLTSWLPISPYSKWVHWSYRCTEWLLAPLRRVVPPLGVMDITPIVAYLVLSWVLEPLVLRLLRSALLSG